MVKSLQTDKEAPWKQRFYMPTVVEAQIAHHNLQRGMI